MDYKEPIQAELSNNLLRLLPVPAFKLIQPALEPVSLTVRMKLAEAGKPADWIYFPESGIASVISQATRAWQEVGIFGRDGAGSYSAVLSDTTAPYTILVQIEGHGYRVRAEAISQEARESGALRSMLIHGMYAFGIQVSQTAVANVQCNIAERLARWILMIQDRSDSTTINITHEFMAEMLGVGRTGVTLALHELEKAELISTGRKRIDVLDRARLEQMTAGYYGFAEREYRRLIHEDPPSAL